MLILLDLDPDVVKPGWTPLIILIIMAACMVPLFLSMRRQFRRIDVTRSQPEAAADGDSAEDTSAETDPAAEPSASAAETASGPSRRT